MNARSSVQSSANRQHSSLPLVAATLLLIASVTAAVASKSVGSGAVVVGPRQERNLIVYAYYDSINHMIESGDPDSLRALLDSGFLDVTLSGVETKGAADLERHIAFVRAVAPGAEIEPLSIFRDGERTLVQATVSVPRSARALGLKVDDQTALWPASEELRIAHGTIVDRRADWSDRFRITSLDELPLDPEPGWDGTLKAGLDYFPPRTHLTLFTNETPVLLRVLTGRLSIEVARQLPASAAEIELESYGVPSAASASPTGNASIHNLGDVVIVPAKSVVWLTNAGLVEASMLRLSNSMAALTGEISLDTARQLTGVQTSVIASVSELGFGESMRISWGEMLLTPGASVAVDDGAGIFIACAYSRVPRCVSSDYLALERGLARIDRSETGVSRTPPLLLLAQEDRSLILMNAGQTLSSLWILAISPVPSSIGYA